MPVNRDLDQGWSLEGTSRACDGRPGGPGRAGLTKDGRDKSLRLKMMGREMLWQERQRREQGDRVRAAQELHEAPVCGERLQVLEHSSVG